MKIGELAQRGGVRVDTVRYYERQGLLPLPSRRPSGYRSYAPSDVSRLRFVRRAKTLSFTLDEIRELLTFSDDRGNDMGGLKTVALEKLADVEARLRELAYIRDDLRAMVAACPGYGSLEQCPILQALDEDAVDENVRNGGQL